MHQGWGKPPKHEVQWVNECLGLVRMPRYLPQWGSFSPLVGSLRNESGGALGIFDGLLPLLASQINVASQHAPSEGMNTSGLLPGVAGGVLQLREDNWRDQKHHPTLEDLPLPWLKAWPVALGGGGSHPRSYEDQRLHQQLTPCPSGGASPAPAKHKWEIV